MSPRIPQLTLLVVALAGAAPALGNVSHAGWPRRTGRLLEAPDVRPVGNRHHGVDRGTTLVGTARNDELLGGHGNDRIYGGPGRDVIWGDAIPGDVKHQHDLLDGGPGADIIYTGHGYNVVVGGSGSDTIHAEFGSGRIDCGPGRDTVYVTRLTRRNYRYRGCERVLTVGGR